MVLAGQGQPVGAFDRAQPFVQRAVVGHCGEAADRGRTVADILAAGLRQKPRQPGIGLIEPAAKRDPVGDVDDALGIETHKTSAKTNPSRSTTSPASAATGRAYIGPP